MRPDAASGLQVSSDMKIPAGEASPSDQSARGKAETRAAATLAGTKWETSPP